MGGVRFLLRGVFFFFVGMLFLVPQHQAHAAIDMITGTLASDTVWTKAHGPYLVQLLSIPEGVSLTIEPGTIVKVVGNWAFIVRGTLAVGAEGGEKVVMTSWQDDSVGGDSNEDGSATTPPITGDWYGIEALSGTVTITDTILRYGGYYMGATVYNAGAQVRVARSEFAFSGWAVRLQSGTTEVYDSVIHDSSSAAVWQNGGELRLGRNVFTRNAITIRVGGGTLQNDGGNSGEDGIYLASGPLADNLTLGADGLPYIMTEVSVPVGLTLTIAPGALIKLNSTSPIYTLGTLNIGAPNAEKVIITSYADDAIGGDSNKDGTTTLPGPYDWCSIGTHINATVNITNASIRFGGCSTYGQVRNIGGTLTITDTEFLDSGSYGIMTTGGNSTITHSEITRAQQYGIRYHGGTLAAHNNSIHDNVYGVVNTSLAHTVIDVTGNWWGGDKGPFHPVKNPGGVGNNEVSDYVLFDPWLTTNPLEQFPLCATNCFSNVLFLPGLQASRMYAAGHQVWEPGSDSDVEKLMLDGNGKSKRDDISTKEVVDNAYIPIKGNIYKSFLADLEKWKNEDGIIADYVVAPYDWRLSLDDILDSGKKEGDSIFYTKSASSPFILSELRRLADTSKSGKVTIIAHSNGGLVAKALTNRLGSEASELIDKVVLVAVPQSGTPKAIGSILHGYDQGLPFDWASFILLPKTARKLANNMPGAYNLLPSSAYFSGDGSGVSTPVITFDAGSLTDPYINKYGSKINTASELRDFLLDAAGKVSADSLDLGSPSVINQTLLTQSENAHQLLDDSWTVPASIKIYQIAGFGEETPATIRYWTGQRCAKRSVLSVGLCEEYATTLQYTPEMVDDGDGTVVASSALAISSNLSNVTRWWVNLFNYNSENINRKHASILEVSQLGSFIKNNILIDSNVGLPSFLSTSKPSLNIGKRLRYYLHSPLTLSAYDTTGNEISASMSTLPGARYGRFGEVQYISLPADSNPTLVLDGEEEGSFTLEIQEVAGETVISETTFAGIPATQNTKVTMDFSDGTIVNASPLRIDYNGDSVTDFALKPKLGETVMLPSPDYIPPEARVFFDVVAQELVVDGFDESGPVTVTSEETYSKKKSERKGVTTKVTITDQAGNQTVLTYVEKWQNKEKRDTISLVALSYNGVATAFHAASVDYKWAVDKRTDKYRIFASYLRSGTARLESYYQLKKDVTLIMQKSEDLDDEENDDRAEKRTAKEVLPGMVVPYLQTNSGAVDIKY